MAEKERVSRQIVVTQMSSIFKIPEWAVAQDGNASDPFEIVFKGGDMNGKVAAKLAKRDCIIVVQGKPSAPNSAPSMPLSIDHVSVSKEHAAFVRHKKNGSLYCIDLSSQHGTFLNGERSPVHKPVKVSPGMVARFGSCPQEFTFNGAASLIAPQSGQQPQGQQPQGQQATAKQPETQKEVAIGEKRAGEMSASAEKPRRDKTIRCRHVLIKHAGSRNPENWQHQPVTRSREDAKQLLQDLAQDLRAGEITFEHLALKRSDCSSAKRGGDLGELPQTAFAPPRRARRAVLAAPTIVSGKFDFGKMQPEFSEAAFALNIGEVSKVIETKSGFHIIERTE
jgi:NIMA-interacting peptidyl-prolyl cis-trans isomerase 1